MLKLSIIPSTEGSAESKFVRVTVRVDDQCQMDKPYEQIMQEVLQSELPVVFYVDAFDSDGWVLFPLNDWLKKNATVHVETPSVRVRFLLESVFQNRIVFASENPLYP